MIDEETVEDVEPGESDNYGSGYIARLTDVMRRDFNALRPYRDNRMRAIRELVGRHYSDDGTDDVRPTNYVELATSIYSQLLVPQSPKAMVTSPYRQLRPYAYRLQLALNYICEHKVGLRKKLKRLVKDAILSPLGIAKIGLSVNDTVESAGVSADAGMPFIEIVSLDDFCCDMYATSLEKCVYIGNRMRLPLADVKGNELYDLDARNLLTPTALNESFTTATETEKAAQVGAPNDSYATDELEEMVDIWDVWLPRDGVLLTLSLEQSVVLRSMNWEGPSGGPYRFLCFSDVPDNVMPLPGVAPWMDLHDLSNALHVKLGRQADRQKRILGVMATGDEDAARITAAPDGSAVRVDNPDKVRELDFGGINQGNLGFALHVKNLMNQFSGNLDALGGLGQVGDTLGQEEIVGANASQRLHDMQASLKDFLKEVMRDVAWWLWHDPMIEIPLVRRIEGTPIEYNVSFSAEEMEGQFLDYNFDIHPYSSTDDNPRKKAQQQIELWQSVIAPALPLMLQQGIDINFEAFLKNLGQNMGMPEIDDWIMFPGVTPPQDGNGGQPVSPGAAKPAVTKRVYERRNRSTRTQRGADLALGQAALGGDSQPNDKANFGGM